MSALAHCLSDGGFEPLFRVSKPFAIYIHKGVSADF